jgi:hydrogenase-4 component E
MKDPILFLVVVLVIADFYVLATSRLAAMIRTVALQGVLLGAFPLLAHVTDFTVNAVFLACGSIAIKGVAIPLLLFRALRGVNASREVEPYVGYTLSILYGIVATGFSFYVAAGIPASSSFPTPPLIALAISMGLTGLFLIVARKQAITQIIGYLILENGTYVFGISLAASQSMLVELGVLLDVLVAVFIMGVVIHHINRAFDGISTETLEELKQ